MRSIRPSFLVITLLLPITTTSATAKTWTLKTRHSSLSANLEDATPSLSLVQNEIQRELFSSNVPLFRILLRHGEESLVLSARDAAIVDVARTGDELIVTWTMSAELGLRIETRFRRNKTGRGIVVAIRTENGGTGSVENLSFPVLSCKLPIDENDPNECVVFPRHEGIILQRPHIHLHEVGRWETEKYPGHASFQFMGNYDSSGGVYLGAHDPHGYPKEFQVRRGEAGLELSVVHLERGIEKSTWSCPYPVVVDTFSGDWMAAADIYRDWARNQPWCAKTTAARDVPDWLREGVAFFNYPAHARSRSGAPMPFFPPDKAATALGELGTSLDAPFVATPFSWEKNSTWIGPDYFPPRGGAEGYRQLAESLNQDGDRLFVFLSGFRWGISKPETDYDDREGFEKNGTALAVRDEKGEIVYEDRKWAYNALLCVGDRDARDLLAREFGKAFDLGIDMVQLDQNVGGEAHVCYAEDHGHPPGPGPWQGRSMTEFLETVRSAARKKSPDCAVSVEEPCELLIPHLDVYHGRAFTYTSWPAYGKGAVSAPVFIYLYHPYLLGYAGWTGGGFDLQNNVELSIGRAFVYGMLIGVRSGVWMKTLEENGSRSAFEMWRNAVLLQRRFPEVHLRGDMAKPPALRGVKTRPVHVPAGHATQPPTQVKVENIQTTAWIIDRNEACYAIANVEPSPATFEIDILPPNLRREKNLEVIAIWPDRYPQSLGRFAPGRWLKLELAPRELLYLMVKPGN